MRHPVPNARSVTLRPGAACLRLNSAARTSRSTRWTVAASKPAATISSAGSMALDVALQDIVEDVVRRQRVLIGLVRPQLRGRRLGERRLRDHGAAAELSFSQRATRYTMVFGTSAMTPRPPDMSP